MWDKINEEMIYGIEYMNDPKWSLGKLMRNKHVEVCHTINLKDDNDVDIYTNDIIMGDEDTFYFVSEMIDGVVYLVDLIRYKVYPIESIKFKSKLVTMSMYETTYGSYLNESCRKAKEILNKK